MHLIFCAHLINTFSFSMDVKLRHFSIQNTEGVSGLCNLKLKQFSILYIQTLPIDCSYIEDVQRLCPFDKYFHIFTGVGLRHFFHLKCVGGSLFV